MEESYLILPDFLPSHRLMMSRNSGWVSIEEDPYVPSSSYAFQHLHPGRILVRRHILLYFLSARVPPHCRRWKSASSAYAEISLFDPVVYHPKIMLHVGITRPSYHIISYHPAACMHAASSVSQQVSSSSGRPTSLLSNMTPLDNIVNREIQVL
jgi:hypothetical protein